MSFQKNTYVAVPDVLVLDDVDIFNQGNLPRNTICRRIIEISTKIKNNLISKIF